jgi:hypothetical protein
MRGLSPHDQQAEGCQKQMSETVLTFSGLMNSVEFPQSGKREG